MYKCKPKVLQYVGNVKHNLAVADVFVEVTLHRVMLSSPDTLQLLLTGFASMTWSTASDSFKSI